VVTLRLSSVRKRRSCYTSIGLHRNTDRHVREDPMISTKQIADAIVWVSTENRNSHEAEKAFAQRVSDAPQIIDQRLHRMQYVTSLLGLGTDSVVMDVGCGIGLNAVLALQCGVTHIHAVEMGADRFESARIIAKELGLEDRITFHFDDVLALKHPPSTLDGAYSFELLEHISDLPLLYRNLNNWLKPTAGVYGRTGANGRSLLNRHTFKKAWQWLDEPYYAVRLQMITSRLRVSSDKTGQELASRTRGLLDIEVERVVDDYNSTGKMPPEPHACAPRDPVTGQYMERLLDPFEVIAQMDAEGFASCLLPPNFRNLTVTNPIRRRLLEAAGAVITIGHPMSLWAAPWLEFLSRKKADKTE
jgi:SAM-dependent methyltransferase